MQLIQAIFNDAIVRFRCMIKVGSKVWKFSGEASVDGLIAAQVEFTAMMELPS